MWSIWNTFIKQKENVKGSKHLYLFLSKCKHWWNFLLDAYSGVIVIFLYILLKFYILQKKKKGQIKEHLVLSMGQMTKSELCWKKGLLFVFAEIYLYEVKEITRWPLFFWMIFFGYFWMILPEINYTYQM